MTGAWQSGSLGKAYRGGEIRPGGARLSCVGRVLFQLPAAGPLSHPGSDPEGRGELLLLRLHVASSLQPLILIHPGSVGPSNIYDRCIHSGFFSKCDLNSLGAKSELPLKDAQAIT